ncbi:hypothetical protein [Roseovarius aestuariivivens]|uniref:hypothetical protein n=1 Tax=Roseovarius aestuariivivens TaxID=1888910 RepID=UPI0010805218|nr:hypothetical protein [Roseovarius aestuariivivens]
MTELSMTPTTPLADGERVVASFGSDRATYWRDHAWLAVAAMALGMAILWALGNPHVWTGAVGGLAAVAVRAGYLASDEAAARWDMTDRRLLGPGVRAVPLSEIATVRTLGSAVQVVTHSGDKHLLKYQPDKEATAARIRAASGMGQTA